MSLLCVLRMAHWFHGKIITDFLGMALQLDFHLSGGSYYDEFENVYLDSSSLWDGSRWSEGPDLPSGREGHCMVQVRADTF